MQHSIIFWDWNGTLLNDVDICVDTMNTMLEKRNMPQINVEQYKSIFDFPVKNYYKALGFDFDIDPFEDLSDEFISGYNNRVDSVELHNHALKTINKFKNLNKKQVIVSAMEQNMLEKLLLKHDIHALFDDIIGLNNIYANGKNHIAQKYINDNKIDPSEILFIGDTLHDSEVASNILCHAILVSNGHHSYSRLVSTGKKVLNDLSELLPLFN